MCRQQHTLSLRDQDVAPVTPWVDPSLRVMRYAVAVMKHWPILVLLLVAAVVLVGRWAGPSDLYDNDQPKTVAYTVDIVQNGRWLLPMDMLGRPATKPPMYNWIGAPVVAGDWHNEFTLKLPSTLATLVMIVATWIMAKWTARRLLADSENDNASLPDAFAAIACIALLTNYSIAKLCYTARPDMVLSGFLTVGWVLASWLLGKRDDAGTKLQVIVAQVVLWLCVAGAALTKGPPALLLVIYVVLGGKLFAGNWKAMLRSGILWGLPLAIMLFGVWAYSAYMSNPAHFKEVFLGYETVERVGRGGPVGILLELYKMPAYFVAKFFPWSIFAIMGIWHVFAIKPRRDWFSGPLGAAMGWVLLVIIFFSLSGGKRADYLAPAYPAAGVLAAFWLIVEGKRLMRLRPWQPAALGLIFAIVLTVYELFFSPAAVDQLGDNVVAFCKDVQSHTQGEPIRFEDTDYTPIQPLLGYNHIPGDGGDGDAAWLVRPWNDGDEAVVVSDLIWTTRPGDVRMCLIRLDVSRE